MTAFPNRRWLVIPVTEVENIDFNEVLETSADSLRYSVDGTKTFVKYEIRVVEEDITETFTKAETGEEVTYTTYAGTYGRPSLYQEGMTEYNHSEILALLATEEWTTSVDGK
jgi:hypothetical protein